MSKPMQSIKKSLQNLSKDPMAAVAELQRIVTDAAHSAEQELSALQGGVQAVLKAKGADARQEALQKLLGSTSGFSNILGQTRDELAKLLNKGAAAGKAAEVEVSKEVTKVAKQAKQAVKEVKAAAADAQKQAVAVGSKVMASAEKVANTVQAEAQKVVATVQTEAKKAATAVKAGVQAEAKTAKKRLDTVLDIKPAAAVKKPVKPIKPASNSRAGRATSKVKSGK